MGPIVAGESHQSGVAMWLSAGTKLCSSQSGHRIKERLELGVKIGHIISVARARLRWTKPSSWLTFSPNMKLATKMDSGSIHGSSLAADFPRSAPPTLPLIFRPLIFNFLEYVIEFYATRLALPLPGSLLQHACLRGHLIVRDLVF